MYTNSHIHLNSEPDLDWMMEARKRKRKRKTRQARCIVHRSCRILRRLPPETTTGVPFEPPPDHVRIGDTVDVLSLLPNFLISNANADTPPVRIRADEKLRGKTVIIYMLPLNVYHIPGGFCPDTLSLIEEFKDRDFVDVEVVFVAVNRSPAFLDNLALSRFNDFFSKMTSWLAVPLSDQVASRRIQETWLPLLSPDKLTCSQARQSLLEPAWAMFDPAGTVLLTSPYILSYLFCSYGIAELVPRAHEILPAIVEKRRHPVYGDHVNGLIVDHLSHRSWHYLHEITNLDHTILGSPCPPYLLSKDGTEVPLFSLKDKVVGLYFCNQNSSKPSRMESIKKTYAKAIALGYDFEIVQINFNYTFYVHKPSQESENVPWLTLPYMQSCCKRLIRIFRCYNYDSYLGLPAFKSLDEGDRLVIFNPHEPDALGIRYDRHGASIIDALGVEAYPFTRLRLIEMERARKRQELRLQLIFAPGGAPLLRRRGKSKSFEQVPLSQLSGKPVVLLFTTHSALKSCKFVTSLESSYLLQDDNDDDVFEVVYISTDEDEAGFDDCTAETPWLVTPYSREFGHTWRDRIFQTLPASQGSVVGFDICGEFVTKFDRLDPKYARKRRQQDVLFRCNIQTLPLDDLELSDVIYRYGVREDLLEDILKVP